MWLPVALVVFFMLALGWTFFVARFVVRRRVSQLFRSDLEHWWSTPNRIRSMRPVYLVPVALLVILFITFDSTPLWIIAALGLAFTASGRFALWTWWKQRAPGGADQLG
jgi:hypothetical protein